MTDEEWVQASEELADRIAELGLTLEQVGPEGAADFELGEGGEIVLFFGDEEQVCEEIEAALVVLEEWASDIGADPTCPGAIVEFVEQLGQELEGVEPSERMRAFLDLDLSALLEGNGIQELEPESFASEIDDESVLCLVEDGNGATWVVFLDENDEVSYDEADVRDED